MIRMIMKLSWELCTDLLAFALQPRKTSASRSSDEGAVLPFLQMRSVGSHSTSGREKEKRRKGRGRNRMLINVPRYVIATDENTAVII